MRSLKTKYNLAKILAAIAGVGISGIAGYISVIGICALFPAGGVVTMLMAASLETGKVVAVTVREHCQGKTKTAMSVMIPALMLMTAIGVYGFLSDSSQAQRAVSQSAGVQQERVTAELELAHADQARASTSLKHMNDELADLHQKNMLTREAVRRTEQANERKHAQELMDSAVAQEHRLLAEHASLAITTVHADATPIHFASSALGLSDEQATRLFIGLLMMVFDPLGLLLVAAGSHKTIRVTKPVSNRKPAKRHPVRQKKTQTKLRVVA